MVRICCATTDNTSKSMRLNSSKQDQAPQEAKPLKERINQKERVSTWTFQPCLHKVTSKFLLCCLSSSFSLSLSFLIIILTGIQHIVRYNGKKKLDPRVSVA